MPAKNKIESPEDVAMEEALKLQGIPELLDRRKKIIRRYFGHKTISKETKIREIQGIIIKRLHYDLIHLPLSEVLKLHKKVRAIRRKYPYFIGEADRV